jgi:fatty-acyl-CoA synthase
MRLSMQDRLCIPVPLYHCFGMVLGVLACTATGAAMVFPGESFDAGQTLATVARERCTALHGVPTMFIAMLDHPEFARHDLSTLRTGIMAGAPCPVETMRRVVERMHMREVTIGYGMTETSPISFQSSVDDPLDKRVSTVGRIQPHVLPSALQGCLPLLRLIRSAFVRNPRPAAWLRPAGRQTRTSPGPCPAARLTGG